MNDEEQVAFNFDYYSLAEAADSGHGFAVDGLDWRVKRPQERWAFDSNSDNPLVEDSAGESLNVYVDVRKLGHAQRVSSRERH